MSKLQVIARFKDSDPNNPRFTKTTTLEELFKEALKALPVDIIYYIVPHEDGLGYTLKEAGILTLNVTVDNSPVQTPIAPPRVAQAPMPIEAELEEEEEVIPEIEAKAPNRPQVALKRPTPTLPPLPQKFAQPKSSQELERELGIVGEKVQLHIPQGEGQDFNEYDDKGKVIATKPIPKTRTSKPKRKEARA